MVDWGSQHLTRVRFWGRLGAQCFVPSNQLQFNAEGQGTANSHPKRNNSVNRLQLGW
jgi:hypothetical protein